MDTARASTRVIDIVCNLLTPEIVESRPAWSRKFHVEKIGADERRVGGLSVQQHVEILDEAGIDIAFLVAPKMGRVGLPDSWRLDTAYVVDAVQSYPDRFRGLVGVDPYDGLAGTRELERLVTEYGFVGAHLYPHWFEMAPDHRRYYPIYAKCAELGIPIQMQVGHCLRYSDRAPLPNVGRPATLDTIACEIPELVLIGIHLGWPWTEEMIAVTYKHPNVYMAGDAYGPKHWPKEFVHYLDSWGRDKVMFGTDWPVVDHKRAVSEIAEMNLRPESWSALMGGNATRVYGI